jgi:hypothetical protein
MLEDFVFQLVQSAAEMAFVKTILVFAKMDSRSNLTENSASQNVRLDVKMATAQLPKNVRVTKDSPSLQPANVKLFARTTKIVTAWDLKFATVTKDTQRLTMFVSLFVQGEKLIIYEFILMRHFHDVFAGTFSFHH